VIRRRRADLPRKTADHPADPEAARRAAIPWLARRDYPSAQLLRKLTEAGYEPEAAQGGIELLQAERAIDDARYVERYVAFHAARGHGPVRIRHDLSALGMAAALYEPALQAEAWPERASDTRRRKFGAELPSEWREKVRQSKFLQYRGFSSDHIRLALGKDFDPDI
jgi:regulatory protein